MRITLYTSTQRRLGFWLRNETTLVACGSNRTTLISESEVKPRTLYATQDCLGLIYPDDEGQ
jgi:hypothetical protein